MQLLSNTTKKNQTQAPIYKIKNGKSSFRVSSVSKVIDVASLASILHWSENIGPTEPLNYFFLSSCIDLAMRR